MKVSNCKKIREGGMTKIVPLDYKKAVKVTKVTTAKKTTSNKVPTKGTTTKKVTKKLINK